MLVTVFVIVYMQFIFHVAVNESLLHLGSFRYGEMTNSVQVFQTQEARTRRGVFNGV